MNYLYQIAFLAGKPVSHRQSGWVAISDKDKWLETCPITRVIGTDMRLNTEDWVRAGIENFFDGNNHGVRIDHFNLTPSDRIKYYNEQFKAATFVDYRKNPQPIFDAIEAQL